MRFKIGDVVIHEGLKKSVTAGYKVPDGEAYYSLDGGEYGVPEAHLGSGSHYEVVHVKDIPDVKRLAAEVAEVVVEKNKAYGNSHEKVAEFFKLLYPTGISPEQYGDCLTLARMFDKFMRIANGNEAFQQEDARRDLVGYSLLLARKT